MPTEIELSIMDASTNNIQPLLDRFESETGIRVKVRLMDWDTAWNDLVRAALYKDGPDISEIGTTWTGDLIGMNALRPFEPAEVSTFGRADAFIPVAWQNATAGSLTPWSMPWMSGSRLIFYRKAVLARAGLDPASAFRDPLEMDSSLQRLSESGCKLPWLVPLSGSHETLHDIASWIWAEGGDFIRPDGKGLALLEDAGMRGMLRYFRLARFLPPNVRQMAETQPINQFVADSEAALTFSGPWMFGLLRPALGAEMEHQIGVALPPGPSFVGGSNLVVWKYSRQPEAAIRLVRFLTGVQAQGEYCQRIGLLPTRAEALQAPPFSSDPYLQVAGQSLLSGRSFPAIPLWGLVEERLSIGFNSVWNELLKHPDADVREVLLRFLQPLCKRLDLLLEGK